MEEQRCWLCGELGDYRCWRCDTPYCKDCAEAQNRLCSFGWEGAGIPCQGELLPLGELLAEEEADGRDYVACGLGLEED